MENARKRRWIYAFFFVKNAPTVLKYRLFHIKPQTDHFRGQSLSLDQTDAALCRALDSKRPFCAIRFGAVELSCLNNHEKIELGFKKTYKQPVRFSMKNNAGYFPINDDSLQEYGDRLLSLLPQTDFLGVSGVHMEDYFARYYCPHAIPILYEGMEPLRGSWVSHLKGRKVLVITPFAEDVKAQYAKRTRLFSGKIDVLPPFDLEVLEAPLTLGDAHPQSESFFEELEVMERQMDQLDYEVLLVGAGAYGSFLALHAKEKGKQAIQTGGATSTLFGIMGRRWENRPHVTRYVNQEWIRPSRKMEGYQKVEKGAYW